MQCQQKKGAFEQKICLCHDPIDKILICRQKCQWLRERLENTNDCVKFPCNGENKITKIFLLSLRCILTCNFIAQTSNMLNSNNFPKFHRIKGVIMMDKLNNDLFFVNS